jgi:hypothetical protein
VVSSGKVLGIFRQYVHQIYYIDVALILRSMEDVSDVPKTAGHVASCLEREYHVGLTQSRKSLASCLQETADGAK